MLPLYQDPWFTFRFAEDRIIPRFYLEGVEAGRQVSVFRIDPQTGERLGCWQRQVLARAAGWNWLSRLWCGLGRRLLRYQNRDETHASY